jgi:hypothetical protein
MLSTMGDDNQPDASSNPYLFGSRTLEVLTVLGGFCLVSGALFFILNHHIFPVAALLAVLFSAYEDWKGMPGKELGVLYLVCAVLIAVAARAYFSLPVWILLGIGLGSFLFLRYPFSLVLFMIKDNRPEGKTR